MACEPNTLANDAKCMCLSVEEHMQVQTFLLATLAGGSLDPDTLAREARCFCGVPVDTLMAMKSMLLCQFLGEENGGGGGDLPAGPGSEDWSLTLGEDFLADLVASDDGSGFTHYCYRYSINGGAFVDGAGPVPVDTPVNDIGDPGDDVEAQVRYCDAGGTPVSEWSASKFLAPCDSMEGVSGLDAGTDRGTNPNGYIVSVIWLPQPDQDLVANLEVQRANAIGGPYVTIDTSPAAATAYQDEPVLPQTTYYYRILTVFLNGCDSIASSPKEVATGCLVETVVQTAPDNITPDSADIHWNSPSVEPILGYEVRWGTTNGGPYTESSGALTPGEITFSINGTLNPSTTYYVIVIVKDTLTCTVNSNQQSFTTDP